MIDVKITREIKLADYAPEYTDAVFDVWVNPPRKTLTEFYQIQKDTLTWIQEIQSTPHTEQAESRLQDLDRRLNRWLSIVWSRSNDETRHFLPDQVQILSAHLLDTDPRAWQWLIEQTIKTIENYRDIHRKN